MPSVAQLGIDAPLCDAPYKLPIPTRVDAVDAMLAAMLMLLLYSNRKMLLKDRHRRHGRPAA